MHQRVRLICRDEDHAHWILSLARGEEGFFVSRWPGLEAWLESNSVIITIMDFRGEDDLALLRDLEGVRIEPLDDVPVLE